MQSTARDGRLSTVHIGNDPPLPNEESNHGSRRYQPMAFFGTGRVREDVFMLLRGVRSARPTRIKPERKEASRADRSNAAQASSREPMAHTRQSRNHREAVRVNRTTSFLETPENSEQSLHRRNRRHERLYNRMHEERRDRSQTHVPDERGDRASNRRLNEQRNRFENHMLNEQREQSSHRILREQPDHLNTLDPELPRVEVTPLDLHVSDIEIEGMTSRPSQPELILRCPHFADNRAIRDSLSEWEAICLRAESAQMNKDEEDLKENEDERVYESDGDGSIGGCVTVGEGRRHRDRHNSRDDGSFRSRRTASFSSFTDCLGF